MTDNYATGDGYHFVEHTIIEARQREREREEFDRSALALFLATRIPLINFSAPFHSFTGFFSYRCQPASRIRCIFVIADATRGMTLDP